MIERRRGQRWVFEQELGLRIFAVPIGAVAVCVWVVCLQRALGVVTAANREIPVPLAFVALPLFGALSFVLLRACGPMRLSIDPQARTYEMVQGFPLFPGKASGPLEDFTGVQIQPGPGGMRRIILRRQGPGPKWFVAAQEYRRSAAEAKARELAELLRLPYEEERL